MNIIVTCLQCVVYVDSASLILFNSCEDMLLLNYIVYVLRNGNEKVIGFAETISG